MPVASASPFAIVLSCISALSGIIVMVRLRQPVSFIWWVVKVFITALSSFLMLCGFIGFTLGLIAGLPWIAITGLYGALFFLIYHLRISTAVSQVNPFEAGYGTNLESKIPAWLKTKFLKSPTALRLPVSSAFKLTRNISFCEIPETGRPLLCDIWQPAQHIEHSGLAFIYLHGSAWSVLDKDFGTRPLFQHLASQGHVIMDVAYRLFPETDMTGMVNDVFRAISWMKVNASIYNIDQECIVLGGASAGGHLALLAAYNETNAKFIPAELAGADLKVRAVATEYGPSDLKAMYYHTAQQLSPKKLSYAKVRPASTPEWVKKLMGNNFHRLGMDKDASAVGVLSVILGGQPDECPEIYADLSPANYVHKNCPPTLILQGAHDIISPVPAAKEFYACLKSNGVPAVLYILPQTDHAFDLILPKVSPVAHSAFYILERFLAAQLKHSE